MKNKLEGINVILNEKQKIESMIWSQGHRKDPKQQRGKIILKNGSMLVISGKGDEGLVKVKESEIYGDRRRFDFGWWVPNAIYR